MVLYDNLATDLRDGKRYGDYTFHLFERGDNGTIQKVMYKGTWTIVDAGYLDWPTMVPPSKYFVTNAEQRFSRWLESLRKDVECTFGIMKGRFRILKTGIPLHGVGVCDRIWKTCCALHNFLLEQDGLDERWDVTRYLNEEGYHDASDVECFLETAGADYDISDMGFGNDRDEEMIDENVERMELEEDDSMDNHTFIYVRKMSLQAFKQKLIEHFDILWRQNNICWPSRKGTDPPPIQSRMTLVE